MTAATSYTTAVQGADAAEFKRVPNVGLLAQGSSDDQMYFLQVNPTTGGLVTDATLDLSAYEAADHPLATRLTNGVSFLATDSGAGGTDVLRTILATRHESALTPVSARLSTGSGFLGADFGASTGALRVSALLGNAGGVADFGAGTAGAQTLRTVIASNQTAIPASQSGAWGVSVSSSALPTGAATETTLSTLSGHVPQLALGTGLAATSLRTVIASDQAALPVSQSGTWTIAGVSGTVSLPTGAATETTLSGMSAKLPATLGAKTGANSVSVVFASDQASLQPTHAKVALLRNDHSTTAISTSAYTQLTASTTAAIKRLHIFDSSGSALYLAVGAAASEVDYIFIPPGGIEWIEIDIPSASRISVKAVDTATSTGQLLITALS